MLRRNGVRAKIVRKHSDGPGPYGEPTVVTRILAGEVDLIVNTPFGSPGSPGPGLDGYEIRTAAVRRGIPCVTTAAGLAAAVQGIEAIIRGEVGVRSLQEHAALLGARLVSEPRMAPVQVRGTVLTVRRVDAYHALTLVAPAIATRFRPGQFVTIAVGGPQTSMLGRRAFAVQDVRPDHGGTVEFVFEAGRARDPVAGRAAGQGRRWTWWDRSAGPSPCRGTRRVACCSASDTAARRCSRWPTGCASRGCRWTSCSARRARTGCSAR